MGRPPIGKAAMSGAERTRRYRLKRGLDKPVTKVTKPRADTVAPLAARIAELERHISEVEQERDTALTDLASMRKMLDDGHVVIAQATAILAARGIMPAGMYKTVLHSVHPDRVTDKKMKARYEEAFKFVKEHERALAKKPPPPQPADLPRTAAEWAARKVWVQEERKAKAAATRAAKKAAKANPPKTLSRPRS